MQHETGDNRACDHLDIALGSVVYDVDGGEWVFLGWVLNTAGRLAYFAKSMDGLTAMGPNNYPWTYNVTYLDTLLRKFPDARRFMRS